MDVYEWLATKGDGPIGEPPPEIDGKRIRLNHDIDREASASPHNYAYAHGYASRRRGLGREECPFKYDPTMPRRVVTPGMVASQREWERGWDNRDMEEANNEPPAQANE